MRRGHWVCKNGEQYEKKSSRTYILNKITKKTKPPPQTLKTDESGNTLTYVDYTAQSNYGEPLGRCPTDNGQDLTRWEEDRKLIPTCQGFLNCSHEDLVSDEFLISDITCDPWKWTNTVSETGFKTSCVGIGKTLLSVDLWTEKWKVSTCPRPWWRHVLFLWLWLRILRILI